MSGENENKDTNKQFYKARAKSWAMGKSSQGKEQVAVGFEILNPVTYEDGSVLERYLTWYGSFSEAAFERTIESLRHCGWKGDDLDELARGEGGLDANEVEITVEDDDYQGKITRKVRWVNRGGGVALKDRLAPEESKAFAASMRDRIRALQAAKGERPTQQRQAQAAPARQAARPTPPNGTRHAEPPSGPPEPPPLTDADVPF